MAVELYVSASSPRLYEELPDLAREAVMYAIWTGGSINDNLLMASLTGSYAGLNAMKRYSKSESYFFGETEVTATIGDSPAALAWLEYLEATYPYGSLPTDGIATRFFYVITATEVQEIGEEVLPGYYEAQYLEDTPIVSPDIYSRSVTTPTTVTIYKLVGGAGGAEVVHGTVNLPGTLTSREHYVTYDLYGLNLEDGSTEPTYRATYVEIYNEITNAIPKLHTSTAEAPLIEDEVYPFVPLRLDGVDYGTEVDSLAGSPSIKNILRKINMDPVDIVEAIKTNEDEALIDDVYLTSSLSITGEEEWNIAGLAETFSLLYERNPDSLTIFNDTGERQTLQFKDASGYGLWNNINYNYITSTIKVGEPGYTRNFVEGSGSVTICTGTPEVCQVVSSENAYTFTRPMVGGTPEDLIYEEIIVSGLSSEHIVNTIEEGSRNVIFEGNEENLVIPLFKTVAERVPFTYREDLCFGSLRLLVYTVDFVHLSWYETDTFKAFLTFAVIIFALYSGGGDLSAAFNIGAKEGFTYLATIMSINLVVNYAVSWLAIEIGGTTGFIVAAVAGFLLLGGEFNFEALTLSLSTTFHTAFTAIVKAHEAYIAGEMAELQEDAEEWSEAYQRKKDELDTIEDMLNYGAEFDILAAIDKRMSPNVESTEEPAEFYRRTTTAIDLPAISSRLIDDYYEVKMQLPKANAYEPFRDFNEEYNYG